MTKKPINEHLSRILSPEANPWETVSSETKYENPWIRVREDQVIRPDSSPGIYGVVEARAAATGVVALDSDDNIFLVGQYRYTLHHYSWEIIEGGANADETPLEAAKRELKEEAGIVAKNWRPLLSELHLSNCISNERGYLFLAEDLEQQESSPDCTEVLKIAKVPLAHASSMVQRGEIQDAMSVMGIMQAALLRGVLQT